MDVVCCFGCNMMSKNCLLCAKLSWSNMHGSNVPEFPELPPNTTHFFQQLDDALVFLPAHFALGPIQQQQPSG
jgi:hypothetical protein